MEAEESSRTGCVRAAFSPARRRIRSRDSEMLQRASAAACVGSGRVTTFTGGSFWLIVAVTCSSGHESTTWNFSGQTWLGLAGSYGGWVTMPPLPAYGAGFT